MNKHANHERRCINELKRNEACPIDNANHAEDSDAADVTDGVPRGIEPTAKLLVNREGGELTDKFLAIGDSRPPIPF